MPYTSREARKEKPWSMKTTIIILSSLIILFALATYFQFQREDKLEHTKEIPAIIKSKGNTIRGGVIVTFSLKETIEAKIWNGDYSFLKIGDTILIKYAIEDPELVKVADKYYMQKYRYLKENE